MHELGLAQGLLEIALETAGAARVSAIRVRIGDLHAIVPESFEYHFGVAAQATLAESARLEIETVPVLLHCDGCGVERARDRVIAPCACGVSAVTAAGGDELFVTAVQLVDGGWLDAPGAAVEA